MGPRIEPVQAGVSRPLWSVMVPTFNCARLLATTLGSILSQDPGPDVMQIEVIDDCSTRDDPEIVVREVGGGRIKFHRQPRNVGSTNNFNTCLERSEGHLVHILHGDDWVLPGFYDRIELLARRHPQTAFFCTRAFVVDEQGSIDSLSQRVPHLERPGRDVSRLLQSNLFVTPAVVIRRSFYEALGGFLPELRHTADWEMWTRAISQGGGCMANHPLACYRHFAGNETNRFARTAENMRDFLRLAAVFETRYPGFNRAAFVQMVLSVARAQARRFRGLNDIQAAEANEQLCRDLAGPA